MASAHLSDKACPVFSTKEVIAAIIEDTLGSTGSGDAVVEVTKTDDTVKTVANNVELENFMVNDFERTEKWRF